MTYVRAVVNHTRENHADIAPLTLEFSENAICTLALWSTGPLLLAKTRWLPMILGVLASWREIGFSRKAAKSPRKWLQQ